MAISLAKGRRFSMPRRQGRKGLQYHRVCNTLAPSRVWERTYRRSIINKCSGTNRGSGKKRGSGTISSSGINRGSGTNRGSGVSRGKSSAMRVRHVRELSRLTAGRTKVSCALVACWRRLPLTKISKVQYRYVEDSLY